MSFRLFARVLLLSGAVIVLTAACNDATTPRPVFEADSGTDSFPGPTDDAGDVERTVDAGADAARCALPNSFGSPQCNECVATTCCEQLAACAEDPECDALRACSLPCMDAADAKGCVQTCLSKYPDETGLWDAVETCWSFDNPCKLHCRVSTP